jgi:hypothetical protein
MHQYWLTSSSTATSSSCDDYEDFLVDSTASPTTETY